jgi:hypothetical protein
MDDLRLGIIGMSEGNGHPYSWSAIFNGYDPLPMQDCPFPAIPAYLSQRKFPDDAIAGARVTHIWTQERGVSEHVAKAAKIETIVDRPEDMIGNINALLLARDDATNHLRFATPFLKAGLPIYIDKPLALDVTSARALYSAQSRPGQIFTCSALNYGREFRPPAGDIAALGTIRHVEATTIKDWDRYAVHVIEPMLRLLGRGADAVESRISGTAVRHLDLAWRDGLTARIEALMSPHGPISIRLFGTSGWRELVFSDSFSAFRSALQAFVAIVRGEAPAQDPGPVLEVVKMIELGRRTA